MTTVHIHARDIVHYDAVGGFCLRLAVLLEKHGYSPRLWAEHSNVDAPYRVENRGDFKESLAPSDIIFFNHSIHDPALDSIIGLPNRKLAYFHNVTPPGLIDPADTATVNNCRLGLEECGRLAAFDRIFVNSQFTAQTLLDAMTAGDATRHRNSLIVCPPIVGVDRWGNIQEEPRAKEDGIVKGLFVGRLVSHKGVREILDISGRLAAILPAVELTIVGGPADGAYVDMLRARAESITAARPRFLIRFHHGISDAQLKSLYLHTDFCIAHSTHEGFCVPALDALSFDKPMFVTPLPALLEVLGKAALVIPQHDQQVSATVIGDFIKDENAVLQHAALRKEQLTHMAHLASGRLVIEAMEKVMAN